MAKPKFDRVKLSHLLRAGKSQKEVAQVFGVSDAAISKAKKELNISVVRNMSFESAHKVVASHLDTVAQLAKINRDANEILDVLMAWGRGDEKALQILEGQARKIKVRGVEEEIKEFRLKDPRELALRAMSEIRSQLSLQLDVMKTLFDVESIREFQQEILEAIAEVSSDVRNRIVEKLKEKGALRGAISIT
jgi:predicted transcriptional regulator